MSSALRQLPKTMIDPPTFKKENPAEQPILFLALVVEDAVADARRSLCRDAARAPALDVERRRAGQRVRRGEVRGSNSGGSRPRLRRAAIGIDQLALAAQQSNSNQATGSLNGLEDAAIIHTDGQLHSAAAFGRQIIAYRNGAPVRMGDVANVIDSISNVRDGNWYRGSPRSTSRSCASRARTRSR